MAATDVAAAEAYLKAQFHPKKMRDLTLKGSGPFYAMMNKSTKFKGEYYKWPLKYGDVAGVSASFSEAQALKEGASVEPFKLQATALPEDYGLFSVKGKAMAVSKGKRASWMPSMKLDAESALRKLGRRNSRGVWGGARGEIATVSGSPSTTITVSSYEDMALIEKNVTLIALDATALYVPLAGIVSEMKVLTVNREAKTFTVAAPITGLAEDDLLVPKGDHNARMHGAMDWVPATLESGTFFEATRSTDRTRMAGIYSSLAGKPMEECGTYMAMRIAQEGGDANHWFLTFTEYEKLLQSQQGRVMYCKGNARYSEGGKGKKAAEIGFSGIKVMTPYGEVNAYADRFGISGHSLMTQLDTWMFLSAGEAPGWLDEDGSRFVRERNDNAYEGRTGQYADVINDAPGWTYHAAH